MAVNGMTDILIVLVCIFIAWLALKELKFEKFVKDPEALTQISNAEMMEKFGTEGIELIMWLVMRGALQDKVNTIHTHYHIPVSNTAAGVLVLENAA